MTAGKLGVDMLNVMAYSYDFPNQVIFKSLEGDVMKRLQVCTCVERYTSKSYHPYNHIFHM